MRMSLMSSTLGHQPIHLLSLLYLSLPAPSAPLSALFARFVYTTWSSISAYEQLYGLAGNWQFIKHVQLRVIRKEKPSANGIYRNILKYHRIPPKCIEPKNQNEAMKTQRFYLALFLLVHLFPSSFQKLPSWKISVCTFAPRSIDCPEVGTSSMNRVLSEQRTEFHAVFPPYTQYSQGSQGSKYTLTKIKYLLKMNECNTQNGSLIWPSGESKQDQIPPSTLEPWGIQWITDWV